MEEVNLVVEGAKFMVIGMSVVFSFLVLVVIAINIQAKIVARFFPEKTPVIKKPSIATNNKPNEDDKIVAAIIGAVKTFKNKNN